MCNIQLMTYGIKLIQYNFHSIYCEEKIKLSNHVIRNIKIMHCSEKAKEAMDIIHYY